MTEEETKKVLTVFRAHPAIKLAYLFGSRATGGTGPLSDYDFALYGDERNNIALFELKTQLHNELAAALKTDRVDVVMLNLAESPELKYAAVREGRLIYEVEPFRVLVEPRIMNEYFDFHEMLKRHALTRS